MSGRRWYVVVDDTPVNPERPLELDEAIEEFRLCLDGAHEDEVVELLACDSESLVWAHDLAEMHGESVR